MSEEIKQAPQGDKYSKLAGNTLIFAISSFSSKLLSFLVKPFLSHVMKETSVMGVSNLASQCANLLIPVVSMGISNAVIRFGLEKHNDKKQVFTNSLLSILLGYAILWLFWPMVTKIPTVADYGIYIYIYVLTSCLRTLCTQFVRSRQLNRLVAVDGVLCTFLTMGFYTLFLLKLDIGAAGYLLAIILGDFCSALFLFFKAGLVHYLDFTHINLKLWKRMLRYAVPMIPAQISFWIINASDLFFVKGMCNGYQGMSGDDWAGLLSSGYWIPTILNTLGVIFYEAWQISAVTEEDEREKFFSKIFRMYSGILFCCAAGIIWLCQPLMHAFRENFFRSWEFVPFLTIAAIFTCFNQFFSSIYVVYTRSTNALYTMLVGAVANLGLNWLMITKWGPIGAAIASAVSLCIVFVLRAVDTRRFLRVEFAPMRVMFSLAILLVESFVILRGLVGWQLITTLLTLAMILFQWDSVWGMARLILPKLFGRRGRALVAKLEKGAHHK